jgi:ribonuclease E
MASPDDARVDEARDQSTVPASPSDPDGPTPEQRPRGAASFPGGPPPTAPTPTDPPVIAPMVPEPGPPPQFQVTTVTPTGASFPGGPPPPREEAPAEAPARPNGRARGAEGRRTEERTAEPAETGEGTRSAAATPAAEGGRTREAASTREAIEPGAAGPAAESAPTGEDDPAAESVRTGGRRRRRGGRGRGPVSAVGAGEAVEAGSDPGTSEVAGTTPIPAEMGPTALGGPSPRDLAPDPGAHSATLAGTATPAVGTATPADPDTDTDEAAPAGAGGSARTRARRRRRAAAKARGREGPESAQSDEVTGAPAGPGDETARSPRAGRPAAEDTSTATRPGGPTAEDTSRGTRPRSGATSDETLQAAPAGTGQAERSGDPQATPSAPTRSRSRRRSGGNGNGEAQQARPANGDPAQQPNGDPQTGTRPQGERGSGRSRRRGRGGSRLVAVDADADAATPDAPAEGDRAEPKDQTGGRNRSGGPERSTRLETRSRREGARQADKGRRRRPSGLTEEQKRLLREEGPDRRMVVTEGAERTQIGVLEGQALVEHYVTRKAGRSMVGNIYLGRVQNVLPGMEAAFVDIGRGRNAVLYAGEVNYNEEDLDGEAPRIEKVLKAGQPVLVQVTKDPIGAKGARLTAQVSLAGRYLVLQPEDNTFGISRRLPENERSRLRDILKEVRPKGLGLIVRTAAEGASADDLRADLARLQARWETVERKAKKSSAPAVIYSEPELVVRVIRDIFSPDFVELVVDGDDLYQRVEEYLTEVAPDLLPKLHKHQGRLPVFEHYRVVEQIHKALERKVWLPSGGSIVIDRTEAMTVIDVNTGKFVGKANLEETVVANNLEAADEIVRQLRLRDIGGIIIIDFIDMLFERNQEAVVDRLRAALVRDKTKSQVMEVSSLGLVQMTRKRVSGGLLDSFSETCPTCDGRGVVITHEI